MYKSLPCIKDTYITNKVIRGERMTDSNVGIAGSLDLFKLYGNSFSGSGPNRTPNVETSRLLMQFDLSGLSRLVAEGKVDVSDTSFWCKMSLKDVYGGQTTPSDFSVCVFPLSSSFSEGLGKDVAGLTDTDVANWLSSSRGSAWVISGAAAAGGHTSSCDYITGTSTVNFVSRQHFVTGEEDMSIDVTSIVSATLSREIRDCGFRVSFAAEQEDDNYTYFVKRFASRQAYDVSKRPRLVFGFNDSITDDSQNFVFDETCKLNAYAYSKGQLGNIKSGSFDVTGSNCMLLKLVTKASSGSGDFQQTFSASQYSQGVNFLTGVYTSDFVVSSIDPYISARVSASGSIDFTPVWASLDGTLAYFTGSKITLRLPQRSSKNSSSKDLVVTVTNVNDVYSSTTETIMRVNVFDQTSPYLFVTKIPIEAGSSIFQRVYYRVRDVVSGDCPIPFEYDKGSTQVSNDSSGMYFNIDMSTLTPDRTYTIDILIDANGKKSEYYGCSPDFRVKERFS